MKRSTLARSITEELKKLVQKNDELNFNEARLIVAIERAVARLEAHSILCKHLVFKGGFVLLKVAESHRFTRDLDALAQGISKEDIPDLVSQALALDLDDGFWFGDFQIVDLADQGEYGGVRINCAYQLGDPPKETEKVKKLSRLHVDIGIGDEMSSVPIKIDLKSVLPAILLRNKPVSWVVYPIESIFSEKLQTLFQRGSGNSRAKDLYDLTFIFPKCENTPSLLRAIRLTFKNRSTPIPESFFEIAKTFTPSLLKMSWGSVQLSVAQDFDEVWRQFLVVCKKLDETK